MGDRIRRTSSRISATSGSPFPCVISTSGRTELGEILSKGVGKINAVTIPKPIGSRSWRGGSTGG